MTRLDEFRSKVQGVADLWARSHDWFREKLPDNPVVLVELLRENKAYTDPMKEMLSHIRQIKFMLKGIENPACEPPRRAALLSALYALRIRTEKDGIFTSKGCGPAIATRIISGTSLSCFKHEQMQELRKYFEGDEAQKFGSVVEAMEALDSMLTLAVVVQDEQLALIAEKLERVNRPSAGGRVSSSPGTMAPPSPQSPPPPVPRLTTSLDDLAEIDADDRALVAEWAAEQKKGTDRGRFANAKGWETIDLLLCAQARVRVGRRRTAKSLVNEWNEQKSRGVKVSAFCAAKSITKEVLDEAKRLVGGANKGSRQAP